MTTTLYEDGGVAITQFAGGKKRGLCVAIDAPRWDNSAENGVALTRTQAETVVNVLAQWLGLAVSRG